MNLQNYEVDIVEEDLKTVNAPNDCDDPKEKCPEGTTCCKLVRIATFY